MITGASAAIAAIGLAVWIARQWRRRPRVFIDYVSPEWRHAQIRERRE